VLRRRLAAETKSLEAAQDRRDAALGSEARDDADRRIGTIQKKIEEFEAEIQRVEQREDADYDQWRGRAHQRRYRPPAITRILDVDFVLE
jgi:hypothetical protein